MSLPLSRRSQPTPAHFHNLSTLNDGEINIEEEEYQWVKKRNAKILKDQQKSSNNQVVDEKDKENAVNMKQFADEEFVSDEKIMKTPQKADKKDDKSSSSSTQQQQQQQRILTPLQSHHQNQGMSKKNTFRSPNSSNKMKNSINESFPSEDLIKVLSPVIERVSSKLSIHSFSDSKESTPIKEDKEVKCHPAEEKKDRGMAGKENPSKSFPKKSENDVKVEDVDEMSSAEEEEENEVKEHLREEKYDEEEMAIEQLFSKVRHNRIQQVTKILEEGFDSQSQDRYGNNLLHICAQNNLSSLASLCLSHGVEINSTNKKGYTPLDYCDLYHFHRLAEWFVMMGGENSAVGQNSAVGGGGKK